MSKEVIQVVNSDSIPGDLQPLNDWRDVARYLHCGRTRVFELIRSGALDGVKVGRKRLVPASSLLSFVDALRDGSGLRGPRGPRVTHTSVTRDSGE